LLKRFQRGNRKVFARLVEKIAGLASRLYVGIIIVVRGIKRIVG
jgi:hypothetical protein